MTISIVIKFAIQDGKLDEVKKLCVEMKDKVEPTEPDALLYEFFFNSDETVLTLYERYANEEAIAFHMNNPATSETLPALIGITKITSLDILGALKNPELKQAMEGMNATFHDSFVGVARF